ncbi:Na/Pi cotransporter family protein [Fusibacter bizertensis]|uniref:Na/Pi cotransporter family protein n=1 Tax=Fusibacter bizertensis TaxID=1488331 RepID=A0ABT6N9Y7_9FIRM|nr:Na/Pi cotransporter family protein [Fusibacter bizertensis]MDH8677218.1 Na/Pi cotransporter family protein [Fusibacter bizertensis]
MSFSTDAILAIVMPLLGGLGLFLYGMTVMSEGLEKSAGNKLEKIIEKLSGNVFKGVLMGALVTVIVQSSSATTVMVVGFVNAGIMNLTQAIGVIMGANIGTTITAQLVSIDLTMLAPIAIAVGVGIKLFSKKNKRIILGEIILGFGILFLGMELMKDALKPLREYEGFVTMIQSIGAGTLWGAFKGFLLGLMVTAVVQSSSATTGIMVALASTGALPIEAAFPMLLGTNVGTCVTALLSSISANRTAKRAAVMHLLFNLLGTLIFFAFFSKLTINIVTSMGDDPARQLANAHTFFNVLNTLILLPFAGLLVKSVNMLIPITQEEKEATTFGVKYLDERILETPTIALGQVVKEVLHMGNLAKMSLDSAIGALKNNDQKGIDRTFKIEKTINVLEREISEYLIKLSNTAIDNDDRKILDGLFSTINDIERVGDHADNIAELALYKIDNNVHFSDKAVLELDDMVSKVFEAYELSLEAMKEENRYKAQKVIEIEGVVDEMEKTLRKKHISRLNEGRCETSSGIIFLDMLSNLERISDHSSNIALAVLDVSEH